MVVKINDFHFNYVYDYLEGGASFTVLVKVNSTLYSCKTSVLWIPPDMDGDMLVSQYNYVLIFTIQVIMAQIFTNIKVA